MVLYHRAVDPHLYHVFIHSIYVFLQGLLLFLLPGMAGEEPPHFLADIVLISSPYIHIPPIVLLKSICILSMNHNSGIQKLSRLINLLPVANTEIESAWRQTTTAFFLRIAFENFVN